jgi:hypothetical protein
METTHIDRSHAPKADATAFLIRYNAPRFMTDRAMKETVLTDRDIRRMLDASPPLLEGIRDVATQIQACGVDLTGMTMPTACSHLQRVFPGATGGWNFLRGPTSSCTTSR